MNRFIKFDGDYLSFHDGETELGGFGTSELHYYHELIDNFIGGNVNGVEHQPLSDEALKAAIADICE